MTLADAIAGFLVSSRQTPLTVTPQLQTPAYNQATHLLISYYSAESPLNVMTAKSLRDFLARWYLEKACTSKLNSTTVSPLLRSSVQESAQLPTPQELLSSLADFLKWADENTGDQLTAQGSQVVAELRETLPRAIEITRLLSSWTLDRRGAFAFPEFLTSFEEGGQSQYDIDTPGSIGALEGYFRIIRVEGLLVEAEDLISEERVWPISFPSQVGVLLDEPYVINLELLRMKEGWEIASCGFAYPPGTEI